MQNLKKIANEYKDFLDQWQWQLHIVLSFRRLLHLQTASKQAKAFLNQVKRAHPGMKFAGIILSSAGQDSRPHVHLLILSDNQYPVNFETSAIFKLRTYWNSNWRQGEAHVTDSGEWDNETISAYLSKKKNLNLSDPDSYDLDFFRPNVLRQLQL